MKILYKEGYYLDTENLQLWSEKRKKYLNPTLRKDGYLMYYLRINNKKIGVYQHRIIAELMIPNPDKKPCIDHINTDRTDNRIENLRWVTHKENSNNELTKKHNSDSHQGIILSEEHIKNASEAHKKIIIQFDKEGHFIKEWSSGVDINNTLGLSRQHICNCCKGKRKTCGGYIWKYK